MARGKTKRLDRLLVDRNFAANTTEAAALIGAGRVLINGFPGGKAGTQYQTTIQLELKKKEPFVSRAGKKLAAALAAFSIDPAGMICADIGCSTGGFTDCLLQNGATLVYAVDVGYGVLDWTLRQDERVVVLERCNARYLTRKKIPEPVHLCVADASFISLQLLLQPMISLFSENIRLVVLVKPQFELPREKVGRGGIVRETYLHQEVLEKIARLAQSNNLTCEAIIPSPVRGAKGNQEFLMYLTGTTVKWSPVIEGVNYEA